MRIGLLAPPFDTCPPRSYGGTERVIAGLADALVERGHDVTLFAAAGSATRARLVPTVERPVWHREGEVNDLPLQALSVGRAYRNAADLDIMHNHIDTVAYPAARQASIPTITTLHWTLEAPEVAEVYAEFAEQPLVSISDAQRRPLPAANWIATVYHGLRADTYRPRTEAGGDYLAFCGRCTPEKGLHTAIAVAERTGIPLKIAARRPPERSNVRALQIEREYYEREVAPKIDNRTVEFIGNISEPEKQELYANALALLFPIQWSEPFGLVLIEALACGTPVIARPLGSVPEIVTHGVTGFHCETIEDFVDAVKRVDRIDRSICRNEFERRFTATAMADGYEDAYTAVIERRACGAEERERLERLRFTQASKSSSAD